jgi:ribosome-binding protein aMBF1 (putative translation factor)
MARKRFEKPLKTRPSAVTDNDGKKKQKKFEERFETRSSAVVKSLAWNIRRRRTERGWSQEKLAGECKIEQQSLSLIESGRANPTLTTVEKLARAFNVRFVDLFEAPPRLRRSNSPAK